MKIKDQAKWKVNKQKIKLNTLYEDFCEKANTLNKNLINKKIIKQLRKMIIKIDNEMENLANMKRLYKHHLK